MNGRIHSPISILSALLFLAAASSTPAWGQTRELTANGGSSAGVFNDIALDTVGGEEDVTLSVYPNPAREHATLDYTIPAGIPARVVLYEETGRGMWVLAELREKGSGHIAIGFDGLPSGAYLIAIEGSGGVIASRKITIHH